ncbi:MAG: hypothetical protein KGO92_03925 [Bacteroidota bacterium]|nr:hypothetical protein [Bacteroidota bacterium]
MDEFKKYIQQHKSALDQDEPGDAVWEAIRQKTASTQAPVKQIRIVQWLAAACILLLAGIGGWYFFSGPAAEQKPVTAKAGLQPATLQKKEISPLPKEQEEKTAALVPERKTKTAPRPKQKDPQPRINAPVNNPAALALLQSVESSFTQVINLQKDRVSSMPMYAESADYFKDFKLQFQQMEKDEKSIKADIVKRGLNDALLDQLINLYQQKLGLLKQLQTEMNKTNNRYRLNRGPVDSTRTYFLNL